MINDLRVKSGEFRVVLDEAERRIDMTKLRKAQRALDNHNLEVVEQYLDDVKPEHRATMYQQKKYPCFVWNDLKRQSTGGLFALYGHTSAVTSAVFSPFSPDGLRIVTNSNDHTARVGDASTGVRISDVAVPQTVRSRRTSFDNNFFLLVRFRTILVIPLNVSRQEQKARKARTCPRPELHKVAAERFMNKGHPFAAQVQMPLEQQALGQKNANDGKPVEAKAFFAKAKELWPKPVPVNITPQGIPSSEDPSSAEQPASDPAAPAADPV